MPRFKLAHVKQQGADLLIVPLSPSFALKSAAEQNAMVGELRARAAAAGLAGTVVPVWDCPAGRMRFLAPKGLHPFFRRLDLDRVLKLVNRDLSW
jgi:hypothetical protein